MDTNRPTAERGKTISPASDEIEKFAASLLAAVCTGWCARTIAIATDPIITTATQQFIDYGGLVGVLLVTLILGKWMFDDFKAFLAMGIYAIPALVTLYIVSWETACVLMGICAPILAYFWRRNPIREFFGA